MRDVRAQPDAPARLPQVLAPHTAELGVVANQVRELTALLDQVRPRQAGDLLIEVGHAEQFGQHRAPSRES